MPGGRIIVTTGIATARPAHEAKALALPEIQPRYLQADKMAIWMATLATKIWVLRGPGFRR